MWPGFEVATKNLVHGIFLNVDCATKFVQNRTILQMISQMFKEERRSQREIEDYFNPAKNEEKRIVVMTDYNSKIYQLDGITFSDNPENHVFHWEQYDKVTDTKTKEKTNMVTYFKRKYNIAIRDTKQPLLMVNFRD